MAALAAVPHDAPTDGRERLYAALTRRNKRVAVLRVVVPAAGVVLCAVVLGGVLLDNLREQFGFSSIHIDRDNLVVETPKVTATGDDGTLYAAAARTAKVRVGSMDVIDMVDAVITMTPPLGAVFTATTPAATLRTSAQTLTSSGTMSVSSNDGMHGTLDDFYGDMLSWQMVAYGAVDLTFPGGMQVQSAGMSYDGNVKRWQFTRATVTLPATPGGAVEAGASPVLEIVP